MSVAKAAVEDELVLRGKRRWWIVPTIVLGLGFIHEVSEIQAGAASWDQYVMLPLLLVMTVLPLIMVRTLKVWLTEEGIRYRWYVGTKSVPIFTMDYSLPWSCFYSVERFEFLKWLDIPPRVVLLHGRHEGRAVLMSLGTLTTSFGEALAFVTRHVDPEVVSPEVLELRERYR